MAREDAVDGTWTKGYPVTLLFTVVFTFFMTYTVYLINIYHTI